MNTINITHISDEALLEEVAKRLNESSAFKNSVTALINKDGRPAIKETLAGDDNSSEPDRVDEKATDFTLPPEKMEALFSFLENRFNNMPEHYNTQAVQKNRTGLEFAKIRETLEKNPRLVFQVNAMMERGGEPDCFIGGDGQLFFTEAGKTFASASANCVYDKEDTAWVRKRFPKENFNGSIEEQRETMGGVDLLTIEQIRFMHELGNFYGWERALNNAGVVRRVYRVGGNFNVRWRYRGYFHAPHLGWRASAKGQKA